MLGLLEEPDGMAEADRRAMGAPRGTLAGPSCERARRSPPNRRSEVLRRHPLDSLDRSPLERVAPEVCQPDHVLETPAHLGRGRHVAATVARLPSGPE